MNLAESITALKALLADPSADLNGWLETNDDQTIRLAILYLIKEQDKKTLHACAEVVQHEINLTHGPVAASRAHAACMNAQAV